MSEENPKVPGYVTLRSIVANVRVAKGDYTQKGFNRLLQLAIRGFKQLNLFGGLYYESQWVTLTDVKTIPFPNDLVKVISVGVPHNGRLWTWTVEKGLIEPHTEVDGVYKLSPVYGETQDLDSHDGYVSGYGVRGGMNEVYILVDDERRQIIVNGYNGTKALLYYQSTGVSLGQETIVPVIAEEALIAWVHWKDLQFTPKVNQYDKEAAKREYEQAVQMMIDAQMPSLDEFYDALYSGFMQAPKR